MFPKNTNCGLPHFSFLTAAAVVGRNFIGSYFALEIHIKAHNLPLIPLKIKKSCIII